MKLKEIPSCLIPCLLVVFTRQLEILVTTLHIHLFSGTGCFYFLILANFVCVVSCMSFRAVMPLSIER